MLIKIEYTGGMLRFVVIKNRVWFILRDIYKELGIKHHTPRSNECDYLFDICDFRKFKNQPNMICITISEVRFLLKQYQNAFVQGVCDLIREELKC